VAAYQDPLLPFPLTVGGGSRRESEARACLAAVRPDCAPRAHTATVPDVSPVRALRRVVRDRHADALVLGSGGERHLGRTHLGRTGRALVHDLTCALAVAAHGVADDGTFALRRVVVGVDGSPGSRAALAAARELAAGAGAELTVVGVVDESVPIEHTPIRMVADLASWDEIIDARRAHLVHRVEAVLGGEGPPPEIRVGGPAEELERASEGADLLVVGARRQTKVSRMVLGSTSEALCDAAGCSVLVVPTPPGEVDGP
jgi:nucleotide-binding universal stress UspA family protein